MPYWIFQVAKVVHFIGLISWFAALFYLPRLFVYHAEALDKDEPERSILTKQFAIMQQRLYSIIMTPAMVITFIGGFTMLFFNGWEWYKLNIWMHWKLGFVILLVIYHFYNKKIINQLAVNLSPMTSAKFRAYNEIATILLLAIVLLAVFKNTLNFLFAFISIVAFGFLLGMGIKVYKKYRIKKGEQ